MADEHLRRLIAAKKTEVNRAKRQRKAAKNPAPKRTLPPAEADLLQRLNETIARRQQAFRQDFPRRAAWIDSKRCTN